MTEKIKNHNNRKIKIIICIAILLIIAGGVGAFSWYFREELEERAYEILGILLTLAVLGFSIFGSVYSNLMRNAEMADGNELQCNVISKVYWIKASRHFRGLARSRAITANLCCWSLGFIIITLIVFFSLRGYFCLATFIIAVIFLIVASFFTVVLFGRKGQGELTKCLLKLWCMRLPINPAVQRLTEDCEE